jgi:hypothetical protein
VQRYFRYLNPIPNNSEIIFEGDENQLNIKVAFDKILIDKPGGKSNAKNILSSGQLNVLAISIFLAINNEQKIHSLNFVGIDDPIQNMDDINQYSMCDIFCMKGHSHSHGRGHIEKSDIHKHPYTPISKNLDKKMSKLEIKNKKLRNETDKLSATVKKES